MSALRRPHVPRRVILNREGAIALDRDGNQEGEPMQRDLGAPVSLTPLMRFQAWLRGIGAGIA